jgi:hypothetical protein
MPHCEKIAKLKIDDRSIKNSPTDEKATNGFENKIRWSLFQSVGHITPILHYKAKVATRLLSAPIGKSGFDFLYAKLRYQLAKFLCPSSSLARSA